MTDAFEMWYAEKYKGNYNDVLKALSAEAYFAGHSEGFQRGTSVFHETVMPNVMRGVEAGIREGFRKNLDLDLPEEK